MDLFAYCKPLKSLINVTKQTSVCFDPSLYSTTKDLRQALAINVAGASSHAFNDDPRLAR